MVRVSPLTLAMLLVACGADDQRGEELPPDPPEGCPPPAIALPDGQCLRPGIQPEDCGDGFEHDGEYGCFALLPDACPDGSFAAPDEAECHPVMPCGEAPWGDAPIDGATLFVDAAYPGDDGDGTEAKPYRTLGEAAAFAPDGALLAVAAGSYTEDLTLTKPLRIWGRCPELVEVVGQGMDIGAITLAPGSDGTAIVGLALRGPQTGLTIAGAADVTIDRIWAHDTGVAGLYAASILGATSVSVTGSLIERGTGVGIFVLGSVLTIEQSAIRHIAPDSTGQLGRGLTIQPCANSDGCDPVVPAVVELDGVVVEDSAEVGVTIAGSEATFVRSLVRRIEPRALDQSLGRGVTVSPCRANEGCPTALPSVASLSGVIVEDSFDSGVTVEGSTATLTNIVIRRVAPQVSDGLAGRGLSIQPCTPGAGCPNPLRSLVTVEGALLELNHDAAIFGAGSDLALGGVVARQSAPDGNGQHGRGLTIQVCTTDQGCDPEEPASLVLDRSLITNNLEDGVIALGANLQITNSVVASTGAQSVDGLFGDGVVVAHYLPAQASLLNVSVRDSARVGLGAFGATMALESSEVLCASLPLNGDDYLGESFAFDDRGGNVCGCSDEPRPCAVLSAGLEPPTFQ